MNKVIRNKTEVELSKSDLGKKSFVVSTVSVFHVFKTNLLYSDRDGFRNKKKPFQG